MTAKRKSKKSPQSKFSICKILLTIGLIWACIHFGQQLDGSKLPADKQQQDIATVGDFGNLMAVKTNPDADEIFKHYKGMDISFNPRHHIPNWVAWELTATETDGNTARSNKFIADPDIDSSAETWDYSYSGYDRGHMAPAGDMRWDEEAMNQSFYMTNICPQVKSLNAGTWKNLEEKCRQWAEADSVIYIVCGPIIDGNPIEHIGDTRVYVPRKFFKVIISPYATPARGIGFIMPNSKVKGGMQACAVTIDSVESVTGHDFFASLPDEIETAVESQCNFHYWSTHKKSKSKN